MPDLSAAAVEAFCASILHAAGSPEGDAQLVARELVRSQLMGVESHGVIRVPEYVEGIRSGRIVPGSRMSIVAETPSTAVFDAGSNFGMVAAAAALEIGIAKARSAGVALVVTRRCNHAGRLGAFTEAAARQGLICLAGASIPAVGHYVVPWGGMEGRLGTNPLSYGLPSTGDPIVSDFATSVLSEGTIRAARNRGDQLPDGAVIDAGGNPTRDPNAFYGPPRGGIMPFGGAAGHKGYALGLLVEALGGLLGGESPTDPAGAINGLWLLLIDPERFLPGGRYAHLVDELRDYVEAAKPAPGRDRVSVPGGRGFARMRNVGTQPLLAIDPGTWARLVTLAGELNVEAPGESGA
jgi:hydroxycarboxylate dehydrogenase B